jgi:hypothetical protein
MVRRKTDYGDEGWLELAQDCVQWRASELAMLNLCSFFVITV